jgi:hypothetical protein
LDVILADQVLQAALERRALTGILTLDGDIGTLIDLAQPRFVLDASASRACFQLAKADEGHFDPADPALRLPAELFWVEMIDFNMVSIPGGPRLGLLVQSETNRRRGFVRHVAQVKQRVSEYPAWTEFDLDHCLDSAEGGIELSMPPMWTAVRRRAVVHLDRNWRSFSLGRHSTPPSRDDIVDAVNHDVPLLLAFTTLLGTGAIGQNRPPNVAPLNRANTSGDDATLLDHIEIGLAGGQERAGETV